mmetsp:Transcript_18291/g.73124  ORF Transcript_18291/g.73124 Transcript_18291/m.73124 type:complete len:356 (+) Transcript_18291:52-1119(+)
MNLQWQKTARAGGAKRFGLVKPQGGGATRGTAKPTAFALDNDGEAASHRDAVAAAHESARRKAEARAARQSKDALAQDASIYDYDGVYDSMADAKRAAQAQRVGAKGAETASRQARYIPKLQDAAKIRELEFDRAYERQLLKEQEADAAAGKETQERFVTTAYKKQLEESRKWDAHDAVADRVEEQTTAGARGMHGFYSNLLTKNIAVGARVDAAAVSSYTHGSRGNRVMLGDTTSSADEAAAELPSPRAEAAASIDAPEQPRREPPPERTDDASPDDAPRTSSRPVDSTTKRPLADDDDSDAAVDAAPPPPAKPPTTETIVASARERYLARKRAKQSSSSNAADAGTSSATSSG